MIDLQMLDRDQRTRIGFNEILDDPVFAHLDWNLVSELEYTREFIITTAWSVDVMILIHVFSNVEFPRGDTL